MQGSDKHQMMYDEASGKVKLKIMMIFLYIKMAQIISINGPILFMLAFGQHYLPNHTKNAFIKAFIADMANIYNINFKNIKL